MATDPPIDKSFRNSLRAQLTDDRLRTLSEVLFLLLSVEGAIAFFCLVFWLITPIGAIALIVMIMTFLAMIATLALAVKVDNYRESSTIKRLRTGSWM